MLSHWALSIIGHQMLPESSEGWNKPMLDRLLALFEKAAVEMSEFDRADRIHLLGRLKFLTLGRQEVLPFRLAANWTLARTLFMQALLLE